MKKIMKCVITLSDYAGIIREQSEKENKYRGDKHVVLQERCRNKEKVLAE
jgi:hypothetical protein